MQTAGNFVGVLVKLTAGVQNRHDHLQSRLLLFRVHRYRNTPAVVLYSNGVVHFDGYINSGGMAGQGLVNGVVHHLINQVVQALEPNVSNVHGGALAHRL